MKIMIGIMLLMITVFLFIIGRRLKRIFDVLNEGRIQLEEYLKVVFEDASDSAQLYQVENEEKKMLWSLEEKESLFNEMLQDIFQ